MSEVSNRPNRARFSSVVRIISVSHWRILMTRQFRLSMDNAAHEAMCALYGPQNGRHFYSSLLKLYFFEVVMDIAAAVCHRKRQPRE